MKQYYWVYLYQVSQTCGYVKTGKVYSIFSVVMVDKTGKAEAEYSYLQKRIIMVEKISPHYVKEIKTGMIFPIVNLKKKYSFDGEKEYLYTPPGKHHTFVFARENQLISTPTQSFKDLNEYDQLYPGVQELKQELVAIKKTGKANMKYHHNLTKNIKNKDKQKRKDDKRICHDEKNKVRRLVRQYKYQRLFK